jgi:hypothetical protein
MDYGAPAAELERQRLVRGQLEGVALGDRAQVAPADDCFDDRGEDLGARGRALGLDRGSGLLPGRHEVTDVVEQPRLDGAVEVEGGAAIVGKGPSHGGLSVGAAGCKGLARARAGGEPVEALGRERVGGLEGNDDVLVGRHIQVCEVQAAEVKIQLGGRWLSLGDRRYRGAGGRQIVRGRWGLWRRSRLVSRLGDRGGRTD